MSTTPDRKIIDLLNERKASGVKTSVSLEYFPPRTETGVKVCHCVIANGLLHTFL